MLKLIATTLLITLMLTGCDNTSHDMHEAGAHNHAEGEAHDHSGDDEHVDRSQHLLHFNDNSELYLQYETLVKGRDSVFLAHLTNMADYTPLSGGFITVTLSGGGFPDEIFRGKRPVRAGIHIEVVIPQYAGERQLTLQLHSSTVTTAHELGTVTVYPTYAASKNIAARVTPDNSTYLEKEAQWQASFLIQAPGLNSQQQLILPATAIHNTSGEPFIYVMRGAEFFEHRAVVTGDAHHGIVVIRQGVSSNEHVVVRGGEVLHSDNKTQDNNHSHPTQEIDSHNH